MFRTILGAAAALSLMVGAASAAEALVTVTVDGQTVKVPIPEGYCPVTGDYVERARQVAALDDANETLLTLYDCADMAAGSIPAHRYAHLKFPNGARRQTLSMAEIHATFPDTPAAFARLLDEAVDEKELSAEMSAVAKREITVETGLRPAGKDATGVYLAGIMELKMDDATIRLATSAGVTVVKGKALSFNFYAKGGSAAEVAGQLRTAKSAVKALRDANP